MTERDLLIGFIRWLIDDIGVQVISDRDPLESLDLYRYIDHYLRLIERGRDETFS